MVETHFTDVLLAIRPSMKKETYPIDDKQEPTENATPLRQF